MRGLIAALGGRILCDVVPLRQGAAGADGTRVSVQADVRLPVTSRGGTVCRVHVWVFLYLERVGHWQLRSLGTARQAWERWVSGVGQAPLRDVLW